MSCVRWLREFKNTSPNFRPRALSVTAPQTEPADHFTYDPATPVPTHGGNNLVGTPAGPFDQASVEQRPDVLVFTSAPLEKAIEVTGRLRHQVRMQRHQPSRLAR